MLLVWEPRFENHYFSEVILNLCCVVKSLGDSKNTDIWVTHQETLLSLLWGVTYTSGVLKPQVIQIFGQR